MNERELIKKAKDKDPDAFTDLIRLHMKDMYRVAIAILMNDEDTADAIQDTILTCWDRLDSLRNVKYYKTWLTRILINKCYDIRKTKVNQVDLDAVEEPVFTDVYSIEFQDMLHHLDEKYRVVLMMYYSDGYRIKEISEILDIPISTVQTRLARGREQLKRYYEDE